METEISRFEIFGYLKRWGWARIVTACIGAIVSVVGKNMTHVAITCLQNLNTIILGYVINDVSKDSTDSHYYHS